VSWKNQKLTEICTVTTGKWDANHASEEGKFRFYTCASKFLLCNTKRYNGKNIILPGNGANVGDVYFYDGAFDAYQRTYVLSDIKIIPEYLYYHLQSNWEETNRFKQYGSATNFLKIANFKNYNVCYPPLPIQQKIVEKLDSIFAEIDKATAAVETNIKNAEALFQSYLSYILERGDESWLTRSVYDLVADKTIQKPFDGNHGETHPIAADYTSSGIPFLMASDLKNGLADLENCKFLPKEITDKLRVGFAKNDDILITHKGTIGRVAKLRTDLDYVVLTPQITAYRVINSNSLLRSYLFFFFQSGYFQRQLYEMAKGGSTRAYAGIKKQNSLLIKIPPIKEQIRISKLLQQFEIEKPKLIDLYVSKVTKLTSFKNSILKQAFNGELIKAA
jgi:type I restriction enzyme S subunit